MSQDPTDTGRPQGERRWHTCLLYQTLDEQKQYLLPFLKEGLTDGEHCLVVCPEDSVDDWSLEMQAFGIDVSAHLGTEALIIATGEQWREAPFDSISKARELWQHIDLQLMTFPAMRIAGDASWAMLNPAITADRLCHWEATADLIYEDVAVKTICMYDLKKHSPSDIRAALRTHGSVVIDGVTRRNHYYEAVEILESEPELNTSEADAALIETMLAALRASS